jgi:hypothetical protein
VRFKLPATDTDTDTDTWPFTPAVRSNHDIHTPPSAMLFTTHMITAATVLLSLTGTASAGHVRSRSHRHASLAARQASIESRDEYNEVLKRAQQDGRISVAQYARSQVELKESKKKRKSSSAGQKRVLRKKSGGSCKIRPSGDAAAADEGFVASSSSTSASSTSVAATQAAVAKETPAAEDGATSAAWSEPAAATSTTSQWSEPVSPLQLDP